MSGYTDDKVRDVAESGELTLMHKPFYIAELATKVGEILARAEQTASRVPGASQR
jgi:DNA-binding response OmpR family regulator